MKRVVRYSVGMILCVVSAVVAWYFVLHRATRPAVDTYQFLRTSCWFQADWKADIRCGELHTPKATGGFILPVVIIRNQGVESHPDPVVYLTGGPGASARLHTEGIREWLAWMTYANLGRDLILMDPRGTGRSTPVVACPAFNRFNQRLLQLHLPLDQELEQQYRITRHCFEQLAAEPTLLDAGDFGSRHSASDLRALMSYLGYSEWNLLGVSYGTRLALEVARQEAENFTPANISSAAIPVDSRHAPRLRSLILDSVYPAGYGGVQTWPQVLDAAFQRFFQECIKYESCSGPLMESSPDALSRRFMAVLDALKHKPQTLTLRRWDGEAPLEFMVNDHRFLSASFAAIYQPVAWPRVTRAMVAVEQLVGVGPDINHLSPGEARSNLEALLEPFMNNSFSNDFNSLTFMAVDCADNPLQDGQLYQASVEEHPLLAAYMRDQWRYQACHFLSSDSQGLELFEPQVPTLLLSGALDPITPAAWAHDLKKRWPNVQWVLRTDVAHSVLVEEPCVLADLAQFLNNLQASFEPCQAVDVVQH